MTANTESVDIADALTEENLTTTLSRLQALPDADEFEQRIEEELWTAFAPEEYHNQPQLNLGDLPPDKQALIGYLDREAEQLPWWFEQFTWEFVYGDQVALTVPEEPLAELEKLHNGLPSVCRPLLRDDSSFYSLFDSFETIRGQLSSHLNTSSDLDTDQKVEDGLLWWHDHFGQADSETDTPSEETAVTYTNGDDTSWMQTTDGFNNWVKSVFNLIPPSDPTLTALMLVNCGLDDEYITSAFPDVSEKVSAFLNKSIYDHRPLMNSFADVLSFEKGLDISTEESTESKITRFEELLYTRQENEIKPDSNAGDILKKSKENERERDSDNLRRYAPEIIRLPVRRRNFSGTVRYSFASNQISRHGSNNDDESRLDIYNILIEESSDE
jgi:hypothetical protein